MRWASFLLVVLAIVAACIVEDKPVTPPIEGGVEAGVCVLCPADKPVCLDDTECVQCTTDSPEDEKYCTDRDQVCDDESHTCVDCLTNAQCTAPNASRCDADDNECAPCETNADCDGVDGLAATGNACDEDDTCVECIPESEAETCSDNKSCDPRTKTCTDTTIASRRVCETCVADSECGDEGEPSDAYRCVPMFYPNDQTRFPDGETGFCLKVFAPGGCEQPYAIRISDRESLSDSQPESYCGINEGLATCPAVRALVANDTCPSGEDTDCPASGVCRSVGGLSNRCSYLCGLPAQCPADAPADTCGSSGPDGDDYCGG